MRIRRKILGAVFGAATVAAVLAAPDAAGAQATPAAHVRPDVANIVAIRNIGDNQCLQPTQPVTNVAVVQEPCDPNNASQLWVFTREGSNYQFANVRSGQCLWAFGAGVAGAPVGVEGCRQPPASNEIFNTFTLPDATPMVAQNGFRNTGLCVAVPPGATTGTQMQILPCDGSNAQGWVID
jgi:hypothetical protein